MKVRANFKNAILKELQLEFLLQGEAQRIIMERLESTVENQQEKPERRKRIFLSVLKNKFLAMAMAGFITLGGGWEKGLADQLRIKIPEKGAQIEFVLETAITDEKLNNFKEKVGREEPEFSKWLDGCVKSLRTQLDNLTNSILNYDPAGEGDLKKEKYLRESFAEPETEGVADSLIARDHMTVSKIQKKAELLKQYQKFLDDNLDGILWGITLTEDSKAVRNNLVKLVNPPEIYFSTHDPIGFWRAKGYVGPVRKQDYKFQEKSEIKKYNPQIKILPQAFELNQNEIVDFNAYINVVVHELIHALHPGSDNKERFANSSFLSGNLREGITQNLAFETVQYLGTKKEDIKPIVGALNYDVGLIVTAILESVFRAQRYEGDTLAKWHTAMIDDKDMIRGLATALQQLGLDKTIAQDISNTEIPLRDLPEERWLKGILIDILARLKITNVNLSPEFLKAIIANNRRLDDWQIQQFEETMELGSIETKVGERIKTIEKERVRH